MKNLYHNRICNNNCWLQGFMPSFSNFVFSPTKCSLFAENSNVNLYQDDYLIEVFFRTKGKLPKEER